MIIVTSSVPKSASTAIVRLIKELISHSDKRSAQNYLDSKRGNSFFKTINLTTLLYLVWLNLARGRFVIKTHCPPTAYIRILISLGLAKAVFSYRDPRDVVLSAIDHGNRSRSNMEKIPSFKNITDTDRALQYVTKELKKHDEWRDYNRALFIRYEEFMTDNRTVLSNLNHYLGLGTSNENMDEILAKFESEKTTYHNYNTGLSNRYLTEMSEEDLKKCNEAFRDYLLKNNYPIA